MTCRKWLVQIRNASCGNGCRLDCFTVTRGHEYDWQPRTSCREAPSQLETGNTSQIDIKNEAAGFTPGAAFKEFLSRRVGLRDESVYRQKTLKSLQHTRIVLHDCNDFFVHHHNIHSPPSIASATTSSMRVSSQLAQSWRMLSR